MNWDEIAATIQLGAKIIMTITLSPLIIILLPIWLVGYVAKKVFK